MILKKETLNTDRSKIDYFFSFNEGADGTRNGSRFCRIPRNVVVWVVFLLDSSTSVLYLESTLGTFSTRANGPRIIIGRENRYVCWYLGTNRFDVAFFPFVYNWNFEMRSWQVKKKLRILFEFRFNLHVSCILLKLTTN